MLAFQDRTIRQCNESLDSLGLLIEVSALGERMRDIATDLDQKSRKVFADREVAVATVEDSQELLRSLGNSYAPDDYLSMGADLDDARRMLETLPKNDFQLAHTFPDAGSDVRRKADDLRKEVALATTRAIAQCLSQYVG